MWSCSFANNTQPTEKFHGNPKPQDLPRISCFYYSWLICVYTNRNYLNHRNYHNCLNLQKSDISFQKVELKAKHFCRYCSYCIKLHNSLSGSELQFMEGEIKIYKILLKFMFFNLKYR
jgi:hypothetical protein